jgi:protein O-mannosyl-transferase
LLFCLTLIAYSPAVNGDLVWDDAGHVTKPELQSLHGLGRIWFDLGATQQYYPLLHSAFWVEHTLWGDSVLGYHLMNVWLHATAACLVVVILRRLSLPGAWLAGFLFALHPVCVETVAWISEQKSTLSTVFYLAAALAYLQFDQTRRRSQYFLALGLFMLALLSKTVTATLPAALLVIFWWRRGRLSWRRDVQPLLPWFALSLSAGLLTAWMEQKFIGAQGANFMLTLGQRCLLAPRVIWFYLGKLIWPVNLMFTYPHWNVDTRVWWQYLFPIALLALVAALWLFAKQHRGPLAGFLFFAGTLFPVLGFLNVFPFVYSYVADHFQYSASLGIIVPVAAGMTLAAERAPGSWRRFGSGMAGLLLVTLGVFTWRQSHIYTDAETLFQETLARNPNDWMAYNNLGIDRVRTRNMPEAIAYFEAAVRIKPDLPEVHNNLGNAFIGMGRLQDAIAEYQAAVRFKPESADAHYNLANALAKIPDRLPNAIAEYRAALQLKPKDAEMHTRLGAALARMPGRLPEAIAEHQTALRIDPDYAVAHYNLGVAWANMPGRLSDAIAHLEEALRIRPDLQPARVELNRLRAGQAK